MKMWLVSIQGPDDGTKKVGDSYAFEAVDWESAVAKVYIHMSHVTVGWDVVGLNCVGADLSAEDTEALKRRLNEDFGKQSGNEPGWNVGKTDGKSAGEEIKPEEDYDSELIEPENP